MSTHYVPYVPDSPIFCVDDWFRVDELSDTLFFFQMKSAGGRERELRGRVMGHCHFQPRFQEVIVVHLRGSAGVMGKDNQNAMVLDGPKRATT